MQIAVIVLLSILAVILLRWALAPTRTDDPISAPPRRSLPRQGAILAAASLITLPMLFYPADVPEQDLPWSPLDLDARPGLFDRWKVRAASVDRGVCLGALAASQARMAVLQDRIDSDVCHIKNAVRLSGLSQARMPPVETQCAIAVRLYLWERTVLQPLAREELGAEVSRIQHFSSFSCRRIRTSGGTGQRMSQHATANAFDIAGFVLNDGRQITLSRHWDGDGAEARFLRRVRDGLCDWFNVTLSPDYNALHADHFHVDMGPFLSCR
ncbi:MAG: extensin family protein [Pseudomonadota bacterium]